MEPIIKLRNVNKGFMDKRSLLPSWMATSNAKKIFYAVRDVSFSVAKGEVFGILGPNGCGKSTLIRMIATLLIPDKGTIEVKGISVVDNPNKVKYLINRVSVEASFFKSLSAKENLLYAARLYGLPSKRSLEKMKDILKDLNFDLSKLEDSMYKYSRGMQQKIAIARGFLTDPEIALLDEPTTGLDPKSKLDVQRFIKNIMSKGNMTIILTSHDMNEVERLCDRIAIMDYGKIIALGSAKQLKKMVQEKNVFSLDSSDNKSALEILRRIKGVEEIHLESNAIRFHADSLDKILQSVTNKLKDAGIKIKVINTLEPSLEDVFIELTGNTLEGKDEE